MDILNPHVDGASSNIVEQNINGLKKLFPEVVTEGQVDFQLLREVLGGYVDDKPERYSFTWNGKSRARRIAQTPSTGTLRPSVDDSVNWDTTSNLYIEGDNLEVLKLLQKSYHKRVKMIYIDPPYNTGKDLIYPDRYQENLGTYLKYTKQIDAEGFKLSPNSETSGRFHTNWLNMMYPRLKLARNLLTTDGLVFISINDIEFASLRHLCNEVFGEENFIATFVWNTEGHTDNQLQVKVNHEYVLCFGKSTESELQYVIDPNTREESNLWKGYAENSITQNGSGNPIREITIPIGFPCREQSLSLEPTEVPSEFYTEAENQGYISRDMTQKYSMAYPIRKDKLVVENGAVAKECRLYTGWKSFAQLKAYIDAGCKPLTEDGGEKSFFLSANGVVYYHKKRDKARNILSVLRNMGTTEQMKYELEAMGIPYQYPKPKELVKYLVSIGSGPGDVVMDFFAGSCPTAQAILEMDDDAPPRSFICVQLPELCDKNSELFKAGFKTLADVGRRRIAHCLKSVNDAESGEKVGCRVFKLDSSNIHPWDADFDSLEDSLLRSVNNIKDGREELDVLYELLLKYGLDLSVSVETRQLAGKNVHVIGSGALLVCLADDITLEVINSIAELYDELQPELVRVVIKDAGFADDVVKTNAVQILRQRGIEDVKSI